MTRKYIDDWLKYKEASKDVYNETNQFIIMWIIKEHWWIDNLKNKVIREYEKSIKKSCN